MSRFSQRVNDVMFTVRSEVVNMSIYITSDITQMWNTVSIISFIITKNIM